MKLFLLLVMLVSLAFSQEKISTYLNLTAEQKVKMKAYEEEMRVCRENIQLKILAILNDEQKIKFLQRKQARKQKKEPKPSIKIQTVDIKD